MPTRPATLTRLLLVAVIPVLAGCSTPTSGLTKAGALLAFKPIAAHRKDTCETQRQVAQHNSRYDTIRRSKVVVYKAACEIEEAKT